MTRQTRRNWELRGPELLVDCYLRLNGYFIISNFILHNQHGGQDTEVDIIGVRFPGHLEVIKDGENQDRVLENDPELGGQEDFVDVVIAEVTTKEAKINGPFEKESTFEYILNWIGCLTDEEKKEGVKKLLKKEDFFTQKQKMRVRFVCFGRPSKIRCKHLTLLHALEFVRNRFRKYFEYKTQSRQWNGVMDYVYTQAPDYHVSDEELLKSIIQGKWKLSLGDPEKPL